ncbi:uncharacterized protein K441DRAFT_599987 [Cenococcum geophilum 1.58]|uniref:uncharacterized protein n=1 Tax=Cenococcum geophilum 1.58 TaxID=794803 RepID=UPI00358EFCA5|nr:hypothetical protein K441DRAFT_599987 [Cenococcum geophilum 1.58]
MRKVLVVPQLLVPRSQIDLGWLVLNKTNPTQDYHTLPVPANSTVAVPSQELLTRLIRNKSTTLLAQLTKHLTANLGSRSDTAIKLSAPQATSYFFKNSQEWYEAQRHNATTKQWLERAIERGENVYVIIGLYTLHDVQVSGHSDKNTNIAGSSRVGLTDIVAMTSAAMATRAPHAARNVADAMIGASGNATSKREQSWSTTGELVFAVQYRKIQFNWYFSRQVESSFLEKGNRWQVLWDTRGDNVEEDEAEEDVLEAMMTDDEELTEEMILLEDDEASISS